MTSHTPSTCTHRIRFPVQRQRYPVSKLLDRQLGSQRSRSPTAGMRTLIGYTLSPARQAPEDKDSSILVVCKGTLLRDPVCEGAASTEAQAEGAVPEVPQDPSKRVARYQHTRTC